MWKCKECGNEVVVVKIDKNIMDKNRNFREQYSEDYYYECISCNNCGVFLNDVAVWEEN